MEERGRKQYKTSERLIQIGAGVIAAAGIGLGLFGQAESGTASDQVAIYITAGAFEITAASMYLSVLATRTNREAILLMESGTSNQDN